MLVLCGDCILHNMYNNSVIVTAAIKATYLITYYRGWVKGQRRSKKCWARKHWNVLCFLHWLLDEIWPPIRITIYYNITTIYNSQLNIRSFINVSINQIPQTFFAMIILIIFTIASISIRHRSVFWCCCLGIRPVKLLPRQYPRVYSL